MTGPRTRARRRSAMAATYRAIPDSALSGGGPTIHPYREPTGAAAPAPPDPRPDGREPPGHGARGVGADGPPGRGGALRRGGADLRRGRPRRRHSPGRRLPNASHRADRRGGRGARAVRPAGRRPELGLGTVVAAARLKVVASLPGELRGRAARMGERSAWTRPARSPGRNRSPSSRPSAARCGRSTRVEIRYRSARAWRRGAWIRWASSSRPAFGTSSPSPAAPAPCARSA